MSASFLVPCGAVKEYILVPLFIMAYSFEMRTDRNLKKSGMVLSAPVYGDPAEWAPAWALDCARQARELYDTMQGRKVSSSELKRWIKELERAETIFRRLWPLMRYRNSNKLGTQSFRIHQKRRLLAAENTVELLRESVTYLKEFLKPGRPVDIPLGNAVSTLVGCYERHTGKPHYQEVGLIIQYVFKDVLLQKVYQEADLAEWARKVAKRFNELPAKDTALAKAQKDWHRQIL